jgi:hypothetical protein
MRATERKMENSFLKIKKNWIEKKNSKEEREEE